jgi:hypothetical protein
MEWVYILLPLYIPHLIGFCIALPFWFLLARLLDMRDERERTESANHKREMALIDKHIAMERARRVPLLKTSVKTEVVQESEVM